MCREDASDGLAARDQAATNKLTLEPPSEVPTRTLAEEVEAAFLEYSMSVIVSRPCPTCATA